MGPASPGCPLTAILTKVTWQHCSIAQNNDCFKAGFQNNLSVFYWSGKQIATPQTHNIGWNVKTNSSVLIGPQRQCLHFQVNQ